MQNNNLIAQLKSLQKIKPAPEWQSFCRKRIISRIRFEKSVNAKSSLFEIWFHLFHPRRLIHSFSSAIIILMLLLLGGLGAAGAAYYSLPGEVLYPAKLKLSKALMFLPGQSDSFKLKQQTEIVRLVSNDLTEVIKTGGDRQAVEQAVAIIQEEADLTNEHLNKMTANANAPKVKAAQAIKETSDKLRKSLSSTKKVLNSKTKASPDASNNLVKTLAKVEAAAQDVKLKSLKVIAEKAETENNNEVNKELLAKDIALVIAEAEQDLLIIITADGEQKIIKKSPAGNDNSTETELLNNNQPLLPAEADSQTDVLIKESLVQAKESLANNQLTEALEKVTEAVSIAHQAENQEAEIEKSEIEKLEPPVDVDKEK